MRGQPQLKIAMGNDAKERPHSFSGGLSSADLRRLKQAGEEHVHVPARPWSSAAYRDCIGGGEKPFLSEQPTYPSLTNTSFGRAQQQFDYHSAQGNGDLQGDYSAQRSYFPQPSAPSAVASQHFLQGRPANGVQSSPSGCPMPDGSLLMDSRSLTLAGTSTICCTTHLRKLPVLA
ncbi:hypothetical protein EDB19DRAFT_1649321 [Suillus lakei]|nr:hypothetical protein EDB19DRAFT_1649321 [Suillus lakei]